MDIAESVRKSFNELGYDRLKEKQLEAAMLVLSGNDTLVSLPTGYRKSIIYAVLPRAFDKYIGTYVQ